MRALKWSVSHAVYIDEIDDEHKEIFAAVSWLRKALAGGGPPAEIHKLAGRLAASATGHFAHEERLMRAARYGSLRWHKQQHDNARRRVGQLAAQLEAGDAGAGLALVEYLTAWLGDHTRLADRMLGAFLRNHRLGLCKVTFRASSKPVGTCAWVDAHGDCFTPPAEG